MAIHIRSAVAERSHPGCRYKTAWITSMHQFAHSPTHRRVSQPRRRAPIMAINRHIYHTQGRIQLVSDLAYEQLSWVASLENEQKEEVMVEGHSGGKSSSPRQQKQRMNSDMTVRSKEPRKPGAALLGLMPVEWNQALRIVDTRRARAPLLSRMPGKRSQAFWKGQLPLGK